MAKVTKKRLAAPKKTAPKKTAPKKTPKKLVGRAGSVRPAMPDRPDGSEAAVLDRIWSVVMDRRNADPGASHSARLLARGTAKVAQKFGEEAVECLIEAVAGNRDALIAESADVLYHLVVLWVDAGLEPGEIWTELTRREGVSGIAEKASRARSLTLAWGPGTSKIP